MHLHLRGRLLTLFVSLIVVFVLVLLATIHIQVSGMAQNDILSKLNSDSNMGITLLNERYKGDWAVKDGKLYKGDKLVNEDYAIVDEVKKQTGALVTIFMGDTRVSTNVLKDDGSRAIGTKVSDKVGNIVLKQGKVYTGEATVVGKLCETKYIPLKDSNGNTIGIWFVGVQKSQVNNAIWSLEINIVIVTLIAIVLAIFLVALFTNRIVKSVDKIVTVLNGLASGNLKAKTEVKRSDEIGIIAKNVNTVVDNVSKLIHDIKKASLTVASSSQEVMASSNEICKVFDQIAAAIDDVANGATEQAARTENGNRQIQEIVKGLDQITSDMSNSKELTQKAKEVVQVGGKSVDIQEIKMNENKQLSISATIAITDLSNKSNEIGHILEVIKGIAEQTNLLALNAAIEAARAGENGKGFAVVADEIRKLAEQSGSSVKKIAEMIKEIQAGVDNAVSEMGKAEIAITEQSNALTDTVKAFKEIKEVVESINQKVELVTDASSALCKNAKIAGSLINDVASIAEQTAAGTEEITASTQEQTSIIHHISDSADQLAKLASELQHKIEEFDV